MTAHNEIFPNCQVPKDLRRLKRPQQPIFATSLDGVIGGNLSQEHDISSRRPQETGDDVEERAFACPVGTDQPGYRTRLDMERDSLEYFEAAKAVRDIADFKLSCHWAAVAPRRKKRVNADPTDAIMLPNPPGIKITAAIRIAANNIG
jgi:hypothetical protein